MKKIYLFFILTILLAAAPMSQKEALILFEKIRQNEYILVLQKWRLEMKIKTQSHSSSRNSQWIKDNTREKNTLKRKTNEPLGTTGSNTGIEKNPLKGTTSEPLGTTGSNTGISVDSITVPDI